MLASLRNRAGRRTDETRRRSDVVQAASVRSRSKPAMRMHAVVHVAEIDAVNDGCRALRRQADFIEGIIT